MRTLGKGQYPIHWSADSKALIFPRKRKELVLFDLASQEASVLFSSKNLTCEHPDREDCLSFSESRPYILSPDRKWLAFDFSHDLGVEARIRGERATEAEDTTVVVEVDTGKVTMLDGQKQHFWSPNSELLCRKGKEAAFWYNPLSQKERAADLPDFSDGHFVEGRFFLRTEKGWAWSKNLDEWEHLAGDFEYLRFSLDGTKLSVIESAFDSYTGPRTVRVFDAKTKAEIGVYHTDKELAPGFWQGYPARLRLQDWLSGYNET